MDSYSLGGIEHGYTRRVQVEICSLRQDASIDRPSYRHATYYEVDLGPEDFQTLDGLKIALQDKTKAGFLRSQFFRVRIKHLDEESNASMAPFLSSSEEVRSAYHTAQNSGINWSIFVVRYTKAQSAQLQAKIPPEEYEHLQRLLSSKRKYERQMKVLHDDYNCSMIKVSNKEGIIHTTDYVDVVKSTDLSSISSTASLQAHKPFGVDEFSAHNTRSSLGLSGSYNSVYQPGSKTHSYAVCEPHELFSYVTSLVSTAVSGGISRPNLIPAELFSKTVGYNPNTFLMHVDDCEDRDSSVDCPPLERYQIIEKIKQDSPFSKLFSIKSLESWAGEIQDGTHASYVFPPAYFPIPDAYETRGFKSVAVDSRILDIALLYSIFLSQKYSMPRGYHAEDYRIDDLPMYSDIDKDKDKDDNEDSDHDLHPDPDPDGDEDDEDEDEDDGVRPHDDHNYAHVISTYVSFASHPNTLKHDNDIREVHSPRYRLHTEHH